MGRGGGREGVSPLDGGGECLLVMESYGKVSDYTGNL